MKKANYSAPKMERVEVELEESVLAGSIPGTSSPAGWGTNSGSPG